ncbi:MAG TPA: cytochrome c oxidase subunit I [Gemmatimonadaceae bacterium]|nr:cytochrome c oxidase subunit I [Gemmatimonadaceae bacterium]
MATIATAPAHVGVEMHPTGLRSWLATVDHKRIGVLYLFTALFFFLVGGVEAIIIRAQLQGPNGTLVDAHTYNQLFTMHGTTMIFLAIMPLSAAFFNFLIPLQIGARDVAFPRLNAFSYWVFLFGGIFMNISWLFAAAPDGGWFGYTPLTTRTYSPGMSIDFWVLSLQILGVSSLAAGFNFLTTIINMRAPGMNLMRMPMFTWAAFITQFLIVLAFPVITIALVFLLFDRFFGTNFYQTSAGADPLLWQHLFWIFGHPEVYILILPAFGLVSEVIPTYARKPLFGYPVMVFSIILIAFLGFGVWAHHMFAVGMGPVADTVFGVTTMLIAIPTGVKIFNWIATMHGGSLRFTTAMLFAVALVALFTIGGISGVMHASPPADLQQTDTYFIVAHFHYVLFGGSMMGIFAGIYHYFPKITGRLLSEPLGKLSFWTMFVGMNLTFFPMHMSGLLGMPRRIYRYAADQGWDGFNLASSIGSYILAAGVLISMWNIIRSLRSGARAGNDPWGAPTLEWAIPSPPPEYNFARIPTVTSRYPLWDMKAPALTAEVPHTRQGDKAMHVDVAGKPAGVTHASPAPHSRQPAESPMHIETESYTARQLGIPMPDMTIKPLWVALGMTIMLASPLFLTKKFAAEQAGNAAAASSAMTMFWVLCLGGAVLMIAQLYNWLLTPLESDHH